ncbi:MAG: type IV toxin-antitoxin system AbiEi family antitoxin domain-containing protein [Sporichthyaceae bacterium]|nr:type IV toxin-antitoxin system AbiEi family antitoxin domain-containing protein [Sporichthyaceae bacterium]
MDRLRELALAKGGVFTAGDVQAAEVPRGRGRTLVANGNWIRLRVGVYAERPVVDHCRRVPLAWHALMTAAVLASTNRDRFAVGPSAGCVLGLDMLGAAPRKVSLGWARPDDGANGAGHGFRSGASRTLVSHLPEDQRAAFFGLGCTTAVRTAVDLARGLDLMNERSESVLETLGRLSLRHTSLPRATCQAWVGEECAEVRLDFLIPGHWVVAEADGKLKYTEPDTLWKEKKRQERLESLGYTVVRFDWDEAAKRPQRLAERFEAAAGRARPGIGRVFPDPTWWLDQRSHAWDQSRQQLPWWLRDVEW